MSEPKEQYVLPQIEIVRLPSKITGKTYKLYIRYPDMYDEQSLYPCIYLLDAQWHLPMMSYIHDNLAQDGDVPLSLLVGITWDDDPAKMRENDLTPTAVDHVESSGGGDKFVDCLREEVIPFIAANFNVSDHSTIQGSSMSGLFVLYVFFRFPQLFSAYAAIGPTFVWDNELILDIQRQFDYQQIKRKTQLFVARGGYEDSEPFERFSAHLQAKKNDHLVTVCHVVEKTGHAGVAIDGALRALQFFFQRPNIDLDWAVLKKNAGSYALAGEDHGQIVDFAAEDGSLYLVLATGRRIRLAAKSKTEFYNHGSATEIVFPESDDPVSPEVHVRWNIYQQDFSIFKRVEPA